MRRYFRIVAVIAAALAAGWWLGRGTAPSRVPEAATNIDNDDANTNARSNPPHRPITRAQSTTPMNPASVLKALPPPGTPLKQTFDELKARADAGDANAASRLLRDTLQCRKFQRLQLTIPRFASTVLDGKVDSASKDQLKINGQMLDALQEQLKFVRENKTLCDDSPHRLGDAVMPIALEAAQLGNLAAINCYVGGGGEFGLPPGLIDHPEWLTQYKENALRLANAAVEKGDWTMVSQLALAYGSPLPSSLLSQVTGHDPEMAYQYAKLSLLGAPNVDKDQLEGLVKGLSEDKKNAADAWAKNAYQTYFQENPTNANYGHFRICPFD